MAMLPGVETVALGVGLTVGLVVGLTIGLMVVEIVGLTVGLLPPPGSLVACAGQQNGAVYHELKQR